MTAVVHLDLHLDPAALETVPALLTEVLTATRAWPGNEGLEVIVDDADPAHVIVVELWATAADHEAYAAWRTTPEGVSRLGEVLAAPPVKTIFSERIPLGL
ncbi:antibiotic biosynthesis monooxygenase [Cryobacterium sp. 1639]|uniref:putative quinol monooxygenase n=1 Tax=Cryobacterium inferilacus TaxID=2866629 RepID=UPI001C734084|nr:antibiotic biosynthesis monooxygenase [Cryobacterium sp. 1639]MBX0299228.1 antibiotic biosynthesis monooxygenase [Cryobacterium sp. 1639]